MPVNALIGLQWGDEGKGKMIDVLSADADWVVRCQGGSNAGHTVQVGDETLVLHLVPSGILRANARCIIGHGVVLDPGKLLEEMDVLASQRVELLGRLFLSNRCHVVFPHHKVLDALQEEGRGGAKIGTTGRGIGPAYADKAARRGLRLHDYLIPDRLSSHLAVRHAQIREHYPQAELPPLDEVVAQHQAFAEKLAPHVVDTVGMLLDAYRRDARIFLEGAQGALLDIDVGTYPFVTSSNTQSGGLVTGSGLPPGAFRDVLGVAKAYVTRVGEGPFPTELDDESGRRMRDRGHEYGATTGRPRRCGWFDGVAARFAVETNGVTSLALTKADVLSGFERVRLCTAYELDGRSLETPPAAIRDLGRVRPVYREMEGWSEDISGCRTYDALPKALKLYVEAVEAVSGAPVGRVSVGPRRQDIIFR